MNPGNSHFVTSPLPYQKKLLSKISYSHHCNSTNKNVTSVHFSSKAHIPIEGEILSAWDVTMTTASIYTATHLTLKHVEMLHLQKCRQFDTSRSEQTQGHKTELPDRQLIPGS